MVFRDSLAVFLVVSFVGAMASLLINTFPVENKELLVYMLGQLSGFVGAALALYFGASKADETLSTQRHEERGQTLETIKTLAENVASNAPPIGDAPSGKPGDPVHVTEEGNSNEADNSRG